jgi:CMP-N,N'-diacetyllegionaminic acid synthase
MRILGLIPARGGSKGVPRKNIRCLRGKPLLAYTAEAALNSKKLSRVILSTEDAEIAAVGRDCGLEIPFMRPADLAADSTPTILVVKHVLEMLKERGEEFDAVCLLQPTNPLRRAQDIDNCIELFERSKTDTVISVLPVPAEYNPRWVYWQGANGELSISTGDHEPVPRRQDLPEAYHRDGSVYVTRTDIIVDRGSLYGDHVLGYRMPAEFSVNIDTEEDWRNAERRIAGSGKEDSFHLVAEGSN